MRTVTRQGGRNQCLAAASRAANEIRESTKTLAANFIRQLKAKKRNAVSAYRRCIWRCTNGGTYNQPLYLHRINIVGCTVLQIECRQLTLIRIFGLFQCFGSGTSRKAKRSREIQADSAINLNTTAAKIKVLVFGHGRSSEFTIANGLREPKQRRLW